MKSGCTSIKLYKISSNNLVHSFIVLWIWYIHRTTRISFWRSWDEHRPSGIYCVSRPNSSCFLPILGDWLWFHVARVWQPHFRIWKPSTWPCTMMNNGVWTRLYADIAHFRWLWLTDDESWPSFYTNWVHIKMKVNGMIIDLVDFNDLFNFTMTNSVESI